MVRVLSGTGFLLMAPLCTGAHRAGTYPVRMRIATVNVNGIRAAARKGMAAWLEAGAPDVLLLQEVRADADTAAALLPGYRSLVRPSRIRGRAGVGVAVREGGPLTLGRARCGVADGAEEPVGADDQRDRAVGGGHVNAPRHVLPLAGHAQVARLVVVGRQAGQVDDVGCGGGLGGPAGRGLGGDGLVVGGAGPAGGAQDHPRSGSPQGSDDGSAAES